MSIIIVGLGNKGIEYENTRHNAGRDVVELVAKREGFDSFIFNKKAVSLIVTGSIDKKKIVLVLPETYVNHSGKAVASFVKSPKVAKSLLIIHDDLDLPLGTIKMAYGRGSGGHKGVESVMRAIKTKDFARLRIGISGIGKKNQAKKVSGEEKVIKHVIGKWKPSEAPAVKKILEKAAETVRLYCTGGLDHATKFANTR